MKLSTIIDCRFILSLVLSHPFPPDWMIGVAWLIMFEMDFLNFIFWSSIAYLTQQDLDFTKQISNDDWP